jgi:hypothetical protein
MARRVLTSTSRRNTRHWHTKRSRLRVERRQPRSPCKPKRGIKVILISCSAYPRFIATQKERYLCPRCKPKTLDPKHGLFQSSQAQSILVTWQNLQAIIASPLSPSGMQLPHFDEWMRSVGEKGGGDGVERGGTDLSPAQASASASGKGADHVVRVRFGSGEQGVSNMRQEEISVDHGSSSSGL